jgi:hypothetical protein
MAYSTSNPPVLVTEAPLTGAGQQWRYDSADAIATVAAAGYFTNGVALGMLVGDLVFVNDQTTPLLSTSRVAAINANGTAVNLGTGTTIGA